MFSSKFLYTQSVILVKSFGLYIFWVLIHFIASHLYVRLCVPGTIIGFIQSIYLAPAPHCYALRWCIYTGGNNIGVMWILCGAWGVSFLTTIAITTFKPQSSVYLEPKPSVNIIQD